jgi:mRNA-degrading endonuclease toxin of MazEF toxin-antitoxin module
MKRGEIWTVGGAKDFAGKPRPAVIVQEDSFDGTESITVCSFTTASLVFLGLATSSRPARDPD